MKIFPNLKILSKKKKYLLALKESIQTNKMTMGPKCKELEDQLKKILNLKIKLTKQNYQK